MIGLYALPSPEGPSSPVPRSHLRAMTASINTDVRPYYATKRGPFKDGSIRVTTIAFGERQFVLGVVGYLTQ